MYIYIYIVCGTIARETKCSFSVGPINVFSVQALVVVMMAEVSVDPGEAGFQQSLRGGSRNLRRGVVLKECALSAPKILG
jgi:hypothetical protein